MELTQDILIKAMKKAVEVGIFPPDVPVDFETHVNNWSRMKAVLEYVLNEISHGMNTQTFST
jgi:hypothetical protein